MIKKLTQTVDTYYWRPTLYAQRKCYAALRSLADAYLFAGLWEEAQETYTKAFVCGVNLYQSYGSFTAEASPEVQKRIADIQQKLLRVLRHVRYNQVETLTKLKRDSTEIIQARVNSIQFYRDSFSAELGAQDPDVKLGLYRELEDLASYLRALGRQEDAVQYYRQAADLYQSSDQEEELAYRAWCLQCVAEIAFEILDYTQAYRWSNAALEEHRRLHRRKPKHPAYQNSLFNLYKILIQVGMKLNLPDTVSMARREYRKIRNMLDED